MVAGDFNARATEWGMPHIDSRGKRIMEMAARKGLAVLNKGTTPTFRRAGQRGTIPDVSLASEEIVGSIDYWRVMEDYTTSDHQYITFRIKKKQCRQATTNVGKFPRYNIGKIDTEKLISVINNGHEALRPTMNSSKDEKSEARVEDTMSLIDQACQASMPRKRPHTRRAATYWWNAEIAEIRKKCLRLRRRAQRKKKRGPAEAVKSAAEYLQAKKALNKAIKRSKNSKDRKSVV